MRRLIALLILLPSLYLGYHYQSLGLLAPLVALLAVIGVLFASAVVLITGSRDPANLEKLRKLTASAARESPYRLTDSLFIYHQGAFTPFAP